MYDLEKFAVCIGFPVEEICAIFQVPMYLVVGPKPREWGNPEVRLWQKQ